MTQVTLNFESCFDSEILSCGVARRFARQRPVRRHQAARSHSRSPLLLEGRVLKLCGCLRADEILAVGGSFIYSLHDEARQIPSPNPTNAVGGSFIPNLHDQARQIPSPHPTNAVGGSFIYSLQAKLAAAPSLFLFSLLATRGREGMENGSPACALRSLCLNNPPTALVGFSEFSHSLCRGWDLGNPERGEFARREKSRYDHKFSRVFDAYECFGVPF